LLAENDDGMLDQDGPSLLRRKRADSDDMDKPKSSLIANLSGQATPPHDFSKKLSLNAIHGQKLFPPPDAVSWAPSKKASNPDDGALTLELPKFDVSQAQNGIGNNTVAIKFMVPEESKRFSINIAGPDHNNFHSVLFHFNPRHFERGGQLVLNNKKEGIWGQAINVPLSQIPLIFGQTACTIIIQMNGEGFDVFLNDDKSHIARLEHRRELPSGTISLFLNFPATDDYNSEYILPSSFFESVCVCIVCSSDMPRCFFLQNRKTGPCTRFGGETNLPWPNQIYQECPGTRVSIRCIR
jgi:Galactoside-binding lectin